jgi:pseudouridine synthase
MRLNRYIAQASGLSRRSADEAISAGRIKVGDQAGVLGQTVSSGDRILLDNEPLAIPEHHTYVAFHKPVGYIASRRQQGTTPTIYSLLPPDLQRLRNVGRLDRDSSGLLVLTDDGNYAHRQTHPSFGKDKRYEIELSRPLDKADIGQLRHGVKLDDGLSRLSIEEVDGNKAVVRLSEGRNRQIRRSFAALGYEVKELHRTDFGDLHLGKLKPGEWRSFTPEGVSDPDA